MHLQHFVHEGHSLAYLTDGDPSAPPVMLVHGWTCHKRVWRRSIPLLARDHFVVAMDLLGHGESDAPSDGDYSIAAHGKRVLALADHLKLDRFKLMGHSMGGQISLLVASYLAPERVIKLVDVCGVVTGRATPRIVVVNGSFGLLAAAFPRVRGMQRRAIHDRRLAKLGFGLWFANFDALPFTDWEEDRDLTLRVGAEVAHFKSGWACMNTNITRYLAGVTAPTLIIFGAHDATVPVSEGRVAAANIHGARFELIPQCGHFPMWEQREAFEALVGEFLQHDQGRYTTA